MNVKCDVIIWCQIYRVDLTKCHPKCNIECFYLIFWDKNDVGQIVHLMFQLKNSITHDNKKAL